jgi:DNA polymerase-4
VTAGKLRAAGLARLIDVRAADATLLKQVVGSFADSLRQLALGRDDRAVQPHREAKSSGSESTYAQDLTDLDRIRAEVTRMAEQAARWLARKALYARTITLKLRYDDFSTITRSHSATPLVQAEAAIVARALALLEKTDAGRRPVRLLGVSVHGFAAAAAPEPAPDGPDMRLPF